MAAYILILAWILLFKLGVQFPYMELRSVNLIPFHDPLMDTGRSDLTESILNVLIFIPFGVYTAILFERWKFPAKLLLFFIVSMLIEILQYGYSVGAFDINDIITNTTGGIVGVLIFQATESTMKNGFKARKFVNLIALIATVIMVIFLVLLKWNMLPIRYQ